MLVLFEACESIGILKTIMVILNIVKIICIIAPILLMIMLAIDFTKNVISGQPEETKKNFKTSIKRIIACILIFFVPTIVAFIMNILGDVGVDYAKCITNANSEYIAKLENAEKNKFSNSSSSNNNNNSNNNTSSNQSNSSTSKKEENTKKTYNFSFDKELIVLGHYHEKSISKKKLVIYNSKGKKVSNKRFDFTISKPIATISENGKVEALFAGSAVIKAKLKKDPSYSIKINLRVIPGTYTKIRTTTRIKTYDLKTGEKVTLPEGTEGVYNGSSMDLPQAHKRVIYYHGDILKVGKNYYPVDYRNVKAYQYYVAKEFDQEVAEEFVNSNNFSSSTKYLFWLSLGTQTDYLFRFKNNKWHLYKMFDVNSGDVLGLNPGSNGGNCNGSTHNSIYASGLGQCNSLGNTKIDAGHLNTNFAGSWLHVSYAVHTTCDSGHGYCIGTYHEGFSEPKVPKSHGCVRHSSDTMRWIRDNMGRLGGSRIVGF